MRRSPLLRIVGDELHGSRWLIAVAAVSTVGVALSELLRPWPLKVIFDQVLLGKPPHGPVAVVFAHGFSKPMLVVFFAAAIVLISLITGAFAYLQVHVTSRLGNAVVSRLRRELFGHLQRLSLSAHYRSRSGEMLTRLSGDTQALKDTFTESALTFGAQAITIVGCLGIMFTLSWKLALIVCATLPPLGWSLFRLYRSSRSAARAQRKKEEGLTTQISEALASAPLIRAFGREQYETENFNRRIGEHLEHSIGYARFEARSARTVELISASAASLVVLFGALEVLKGHMTPGTVLVFSTYLNSLYRPIRQVAKLSMRLSAAAVSARRVNEVLEVPPEPKDPPDAIDATTITGDLVFDRVGFAYDGGQPVLSDVSFRAKPGQRIALVGGSGAGKSTIASLILRLYDPTSGTIRLDGVDIRQYKRESLRRSIAVALQDSLIMGATIRDNIAYGKLDATESEIVAAARAANAHPFIERLPMGYDTIIGERGSTLSGGQRQRLAIARAMIRDAPILLLDEPMTGLDRRSQARVQRAIDRAARGRTCLVITHDIGTAATADLVLMVDGGRIAEAGPHTALATRSPGYRALFRLDEVRADVQPIA